MLHETERYNPSDRYVVVGLDPNGQGGGIIGTAPKLEWAHNIQVAAIKLNYSQVRVYTWDEFMNGVQE